MNLKRGLLRCTAAMMAYVFLAAGSVNAEQIVRQGSGNTATQAWKVYTVAPPSTSSSSARGTNSPVATSTTVNSNGTACTAAGGASCTIILASIEVVAWTNITITIRNSGANALTNVLIEFSPDNSNFEVWDSTSFAALASGAILSMAFAGNSRRYLRIEGRSAAGTTTVVNLTMNDG